MQNFTELINASNSGSKAAKDELIPLIYGELKMLAAKYMRRESSGHTLQTTALVHEAYIKFAGQDSTPQNKSHFFALAAQSIRRVLVDHARAKKSEKRGGDFVKTEWKDDQSESKNLSPEEIIALDGAMEKLKAMNLRQAQIVDLKFFSGMSNEEVAQALSVSEATVKRDWLVARAWLTRELKSDEN